MIETRNIDDVYDFYEDNNPIAIAKPRFRKLINAYLKYLMRKVFEGHEIQLSGGDSLGRLSLRGKKQKIFIQDNGDIKGLCIDWKTTYEKWGLNPELKEKKQYFYHMNEHSGGITYSFHWEKEKAKLPNKFFYALTPSRRNKRTVPKLVREGKEYFVEQNRIL